MNPRVWSKGMYSSSSIHLDGCTEDHLSSVQPDPMLSNSDVSGVSVSSHKDRRDIKILPDSSYYSSSDAGSSLTSSSQLELSPSRNSFTGHLPTRKHSSPASSSCSHHEWSLNSGHQAKRARVENIIKGMTSYPGMHCTDVRMNQESDGMQESEKIQDQELMVTRKQLEVQHHLRQLSTGVTNTTDSSKDEKYPTQNDSSETSPFTDSLSESEGRSRKYQGWKKVKLMNYFQSKPERIKLMADVLKYELSRAVSRSVDSIFKSMPILHTSPIDEGNIETGSPPNSSAGKDDKLSCCVNAEMQVPDVQTEALSLVVQKPRLERADKLIFQSRSRARPKLPVPFGCDSALREDQTSERNHNTARHHALRCLHVECSEVAKFDTRWNSVKVRSKVNSRSTVSVDPILLESLCLPHVKIESDCLVKNKLYMMNEGLTTNHLKKAKLMFFYTRYPSSLVLKMCFHEVQVRKYMQYMLSMGAILLHICVSLICYIYKT
ncbi:prospero homeobox protein 1-like [Plectropomus leopardus]|uniref:prospero homeobox protein 1-like n=1 Tax=Plectropomus leopardus TaxID=160734 RepID=UPI001C4BACD8|nr:prospero homeobox protein 1-like [Plectropomus leopardus]